MNNQNLRRSSPTEARENGRKGGLTRAANARRRKEHQERWKELLETEDIRGMTIQEVMDRAIAKKATTGDIQAYEKVMEYAGLSVRIELREKELDLKREELQLRRKELSKTNELPENKPDPRSDILEQIRKAMSTEDDDGPADL